MRRQQILNRQWLRTLCCAAAVLGSAQLASAAEYDLTDLGAAPVSYIEHRFDINASGRAAFTGLVSGMEHAMYSQAGAAPVDLNITSGPLTSTQTRAEGINDAGHIVGYRRTGPSIFREAILWRNTGSGYTPLGTLHSALTGSPQISSSYDISNGTPGSGAAFVVGYWRDTFQTPSKAVLWTIDGNGAVLATEAIPQTSGSDYNIAYAVNDDGIVVGGEGAFGTTAMYAFIYDSVANSVAPVPGVQASDGFSTSVAAGISENFVTGYALETSSGNVTAFIHEIGTSNTETGIKIGPNAGTTGPRSLGYSVSENGGNPVVMGLSEVNGSTGSMGGLIYDREGSNPQECDVNFSGGWAGRVTHVFAMNASGQGIGLRSNGGTQAVFIEDITAEPLSTDFFYRDLENAGATDYYWGRITGGGAGSAAVMFSNSPGCGAAFSCDASTDLSDEGTSGSDFFLTDSRPFASGTAYTPQFTVDPTSFVYAQALANSCDFSGTGTTPTIPGANVNPAGVDPWGDTWADCTAWTNAETNISQGSAYCLIGGSCVPQGTDEPGEECRACYTANDPFDYSNDQDTTACASDGLSCTEDQCINGDCDHATVTAGTCLVSGTCYGEDQQNPGNECEACQSGTTQTAFTDDPNGTSCNASDPYACTVPQCQGGNCNQRAAFTGCQIGSSCYAFNQDRPGNECQACRSGSPETWTNDSNGTGCNTDSCYASQTCGSGSCSVGTAVVDPRENDDTWNARTNFPSQTEDQNFRIGQYAEYSNGTIFPENNDDWFAGYFDDYACDRGRYPACGTESYNCDWLNNCSTRNRVCNINCGFGGGASKNWDEPGYGQGPQIRIRLASPASSDFDFCVYLQCAVFGNSPGTTWFGGGNSNYTSVSASIDGRTLSGRCFNNTGNGSVTDIEVVPDCPSENDTTRTWVRVFDQTNGDRCNAPYNIRFGNDLP